MGSERVSKAEIGSSELGAGRSGESTQIIENFAFHFPVETSESLKQVLAHDGRFRSYHPRASPSRTGMVNRPYLCRRATNEKRPNVPRARI